MPQPQRQLLHRYLLCMVSLTVFALNYSKGKKEKRPVNVSTLLFEHLEYSCNTHFMSLSADSGIDVSPASVLIDLAPYYGSYFPSSLHDW